MNNEELKKKIVEIIRYCYVNEKDYGYIFDLHIEEKINAIADALIAAGIGDVKEAEAESNRYEMLYKMQSRDMALAERKAYESEHRAEVAEKAGRIIQRDMARVFDISNPRVCELIANIWDLAKKQAEKELAEEEKDGNKTD